MAKHSPGPWEVKLNYDNMLHEELPGRHTVKDADGWNVARIWELTNSEANARLIAAAPDMLKALKSLFENCEMVHKYWGDGGNAKEANEAIAAARTAIAKAEAE
jgi:hypothetical protein